MNQAQYSRLFSFLFNIANDVLVQAFEKGDYKKIILPFIVLRRLDLLLEPTKEAVMKFCQTEEFQLMPEVSQEQQLCMLTRFPFYNTSAFTMKTLRAEIDSTRQRQNFEAYLDGFSLHVQDIITKFDLRHFVEKLSSVGRLGDMIEKMTDENINLGNTPILEAVTDEETGEEITREKLPALDNHTMGTLFEELLRKFNEDFSVTEAGEHYTPRDYVNLLADLAIL
ncbi:type I restriction-modification system, M subunit, partial [gut metagenome]